MERIHVSVRARPLSLDDAKTSPWRISGNSIFIPNHSSRFDFDRIFAEDCNTSQVYHARTRDLVSAAVKGFNGTVFAYGQTSSGKTHTMRGSASEPGVIPLAVRDLFDILQQDGDREFLLRMSYMEIYNEEINDLLAPEHRKLQIHENLERGIYVAGLREEIVATPEQVLDLMAFGESHRHIGETNMNVYSSRSHTIFRMIIESRDRNEDEVSESSCDAVRVSVLNLVDLAGSERAAKTGAEGIRLKEGSHINKSLMTLGTVIKKLSEGAENQGGHVPYRDSKLTRILQPALGGNANTAIICNITLAQIHADETKSSLQFASRALRVTNCAQVNEILTDAALLKRQKKEIQELRAKLQASHSEHSEDEILSLRNKLLQTELERERIALELEEGKKAQAEREKRLQEQARKIENLSSMVLYSNRDEKCDYVKKEKRRDTWCPGKLSRVMSEEAYSTVKSKESTEDPTRSKRSSGPLLSFENLVNESEICTDSSCRSFKDDRRNVTDDCTIPDPGVLLHVTNRRKVPVMKKSLPVENKELAELQAEYEELFLKFETERTMNDIQLDCMRRQLRGNDLVNNLNYQDNENTDFQEESVTLRESKAILVIKQLQQQIKMLEMDKSSSQKNLDGVVELATEQNMCAIEKFKELSEELSCAREEAREARERLASSESVSKTDENLDSSSNLSIEIHNILSEVQESFKLVESFSLLLDESYRSFSSLSHIFLDFKSFMHHSSMQELSIVSDHKKLHSHLVKKVSDLEDEKCLLYNQSVDLQKHIHQLKLDAEKTEKSLTELMEQHEGEKLELLSVIQAYEKENSSLSSSFLAKEKENLRKGLEKTKAKLTDMEHKFKNAIQEKTKLEGEKAFAERELKRLQGQKAYLERDMNKRDSIATKRRDSVAGMSLDPRKAKALAAPFNQAVQDEYKKMEVVAFEMEATIASLEEELAAARREKEEAVSSSETLASELEVLSEKLHASNLETFTLHEEVFRLKSRLEEHESYQQQFESHIKKLEEEKENMAMQLTDSLLDMEEERALWSSERASVEAIEEKSKECNAEIMSLSKEMSEVKNELETCRNDCKGLEERLACMEETAKEEKKCSMEKSMQLDKLKTDLEIAIAASNRSEEILKSSPERSSSELRSALQKIEELREESSILKSDREKMLIQIGGIELEPDLSNAVQGHKEQLLVIAKERDDLICQIKELNSYLVDYKSQVEELSQKLSSLEEKMHQEKLGNSKEQAKLKMRLRGTQAKSEGYLFRYKEEMEEKKLMNRKFEDASKKLKHQLSEYGREVLNLKRQLASAQAQ